MVYDTLYIYLIYLLHIDPMVNGLVLGKIGKTLFFIGKSMVSKIFPSTNPIKWGLFSNRHRITNKEARFGPLAAAAGLFHVRVPRIAIKRAMDRSERICWVP